MNKYDQIRSERSTTALSRSLTEVDKLFCGTDNERTSEIITETGVIFQESG